MSAVVDRYWALAPREFPNLRRLTLSEGESVDGVAEVGLEMRFSGAGPEGLVVRCSGVRDFTFRQPFTSDMKLHALDVRDSSDAGLEAIRFEVRDLEEECLSFKCRTFEAERAS
jgi:hypothetical protein